jgi:hypothetical protein
MDLPVASTTIIVSGITTISWVSALSRREISRRSVIRRSPIGIGIGRRRVVAAIGVIVAAARGRGRIVLHGTARRRSITGAIIIVIATRTTISVAVTTTTARTISAGRATPIVVVHGRRIRSTSWGAGSTALARRHVRLSLECHVRLEFLQGEGASLSYVSNALDSLSLEFTPVELLNSRSKVCCSLEFDETVPC